MITTNVHNLPAPVAAALAHSGECWVWTKGKTTAGYGLTGTHQKRQYVHRLVYEVVNGPIPQGLQIDHLCRNRACANPAHLEAVTQAENKRRGISGAANTARALARTHCSHGHPWDAENTYQSVKRRVCRACKREEYHRNKGKRHAIHE